jgi:rapamycin-insensitive companion of mTOR
VRIGYVGCAWKAIRFKYVVAGVLNTNLFIETGGVAAITRNLLECQTPKIAESLCGVLLLLLDKPSTRNQAAIDLHSIAAPYCDFHYRHGWKDKDKYV